MVDRRRGSPPNPWGIKLRRCGRLPKTLGAAARRFTELDEQARELAALAEAAKREKAEAEEALLQTFSKDDLSQVRVGGALVYVTRSEVPVPEDWDEIYRYVKRRGAFDLLQRRLATNAVRERWRDGKTVPGVTKFTRVGLGVRRS